MFFLLMVSFGKGISTITTKKIGSVSCQCTCHDTNDPLIGYDAAGNLDLNIRRQSSKSRSSPEVKYQPIVHGHTISPKTVKVIIPKLAESYDSRVAVQSIEKVPREDIKNGDSKSSYMHEEKMNAMEIPMFAVKSSQLLKTLKPPKRIIDSNPSSSTFPPPPPPPSSKISSEVYTNSDSPLNPKVTGTKTTTSIVQNKETTSDITTIPTTITSPTTSATTTTTVTTTTSTTPSTTPEITTLTTTPTTQKLTTKRETTTVKTTTTTKGSTRKRVTIVRHRPSSRKNFQSNNNNSRKSSTTLWSSQSSSNGRQSSSQTQTWNSRSNGNTWNSGRTSSSSSQSNSGQWNNLPQSGFFPSNRNSQTRPLANKPNPPSQQFSSSSMSQNRQFSMNSRQPSQSQSSMFKPNSHQSRPSFGNSWSRDMPNQNRMSSKSSTNSRSSSQSWSLPKPKFSYKPPSFQGQKQNFKTKFSIPFENYRPPTTYRPKTTSAPKSAANWGLTNFQDRKFRSQQEVNAEVPSLQLFVTVPRLEVNESVTDAPKVTTVPPAVEFKMPAHSNSSKLNNTSTTSSSGSIEMLSGLIQTLKTKNGGTGVAQLLKDLMGAKSQNQMDSMIMQLQKEVGPSGSSSTKISNATQNLAKTSNSGLSLLTANQMPGVSNSMAMLDRDMWNPEPTHPSERNFVTTEPGSSWDFTTPVPNSWNMNSWNKLTTGLPQSITPIANNQPNLGPVGQTGNIHQNMFNFESWMPSNTHWNSNNRQSVLFTKAPTVPPTVKDVKPSKIGTKEKSPPINLEPVQNAKTEATNVALPSASANSGPAALTDLLKQLTVSSQTNSGTPSVSNTNTNNANLIDLLQQLTAAGSSKQPGLPSSSSNLLQNSGKSNQNAHSSNQINSALANIPNMADFMGLQNQAMMPNMNTQGFPNIPNFGVPGMEFPGHMAGMGTIGGWENPFK
ncbi:hypothetical protein FSP39_013860 [Pinctada imbricata]|uniref:Uncharacterized protein n=1 Tax=Pinctada imbricata TaxID=66713 RepID=A0AA88XUN5_PINIB|nr:hypothetical protein FSP39_013860 [Pinctada imbricata]